MRAVHLLIAALLPACAAPTPAPNGAAEAPVHWRSLLDGVSERALGSWTSCGFGGQGEVSGQDGAIVLSRGEPMTGIVWTAEPPHGDYEIEVEAARLVGTDFFCALTLPIGDEFASVVLGGWGGSLVGLSCIDGEDASQNSTKVFRGFERGRFYTLRVRVTSDRIVAWLDDTDMILDVARAGRKFQVRTEVERCKPLGIASYNTTAVLRSIRWRPLYANRK